MSALDYLEAGLLAGGKLRDDLMPHVRAIALTWAPASVDPCVVEVLAELFARWAAELGDSVATDSTARALNAHLALPMPVQQLVDKALAHPVGATELAALAVHLLDIAEAMALRVFVAELPALSAKSDRTGHAARMVGTARHLKG